MSRATALVARRVGRAARRGWERGIPPGALGAGRRRREDGQVTLLIIGLTVVALMLILGTVAVTSAQLSRMRLLDVADAAALDAADALDASAYTRGVQDAVPLSDASVRASVGEYVAGRPLPVGISSWRLDAGTGSPDGRTAVVAMSCQADLPMVGPLLDALGTSVTIQVVSRARADVQVP